MCWIRWQIWCEECFWVRRQMDTVEQKAQSSLLKERLLAGQSYVGDQMAFLALWIPHSALSTYFGYTVSTGTWFRFYPLVHKCPVQVCGSYLGQLLADTIFSSSLKHSWILPVLLRSFAWPVTAELYPKETRLCSIIFHYLLPLGAVLPFQTVDVLRHDIPPWNAELTTR